MPELARGSEKGLDLTGFEPRTGPGSQFNQVPPKSKCQALKQKRNRLLCSKVGDCRTGACLRQGKDQHSKPTLTETLEQRLESSA